MDGCKNGCDEVELPGFDCTVDLESVEFMALLVFDCSLDVGTVESVLL